MRKRPVALIVCALLFLYFPLEFYWRWSTGQAFLWFGFFLSVVLPLTLLIGLIRVSKVGWYTLVAVVSLWGILDLYHYYASHGTSLSPLLIHIGIYCISLGYFINPRIRHLYFDPKLRWWRAKPRYETHIPFLIQDQENFHYPILRNVSEGGCFIETGHEFGINDKLQISIPLPIPLNVSVIKTDGEVRWLSDNPLRRGVGIQFKDLSPEIHRALQQYVHRQL